MTDGGQDESNAPPTPSDRAIAAMQTAVEGLEKAHADADNAATAGAAEQEHVSEFVGAVGEALANGLNEPVGLYAGAVAEETQYYSKTDLKQKIKDKSEEHRGGDKDPLDEFVEERLESVKVVKTTDHKQGADYIWNFGTFQVETRSGKDGRGHFRFDQFRNLIHESGGVNLARPVKDRRGGEEWRDFMADMIDDRGEEQYTVGRRTQAFEALSNKLKRLTGYGTPDGALDHTGLWVVCDSHDLPEWWAGLSDLHVGDSRDLSEDAVEQVRVHESVITPILDDKEVSRSAFYHELDARNLTVPGTSGASMVQWVNGSEERFWTLSPDAGTPRTYVPDANAGEQLHTGSLLGGDSTDEQNDDQPEEHAEPASEGAEATGDGDGFDSVGDTA